MFHPRDSLITINFKYHAPHQNVQRSIIVNSKLVVWELCVQIADTLKIQHDEYKLFEPAIGEKSARWLDPNMTIRACQLDSNTVLDYKKTDRMLLVKLIDGSQKKLVIDDSLTVGEILLLVCKKLLINQPFLFSLHIEGKPADSWLKENLPLCQQNVQPNDVLILAKRLYIPNEITHTTDPSLVHQLYAQCRHDLFRGVYSVPQDKLAILAAIEFQISQGDFSLAKSKLLFAQLHRFIPAQLIEKYKFKEKQILFEHRKLIGTHQVDAKHRYIMIFMSFPEYGYTYFDCYEKRVVKLKEKVFPVRIGISYRKITRTDPQDGTSVGSFKMVDLKHWTIYTDTFTFDFGEHTYQVRIAQADAMSSLIGAYMKLIRDCGVNSSTTLPEFKSSGKTSKSKLITDTDHSPSQQLLSFQNVKISDIPTVILILNQIVVLMKADHSSTLSSESPSSTVIDQYKRSVNNQISQLERNVASLVSSCQPLELNFNSVFGNIKSIVSPIIQLSLSSLQSPMNERHKMSTTKAIETTSTALIELLEVILRIIENPHDPKTRESFQLASQYFNDLLLLIKGVNDSAICDNPCKRLFTQHVLFLYLDFSQFLVMVNNVTKHIKDGKVMRLLVNETKSFKAQLKYSKQAMLHLSPVLLSPAVITHIHDSLKQSTNIISSIHTTISKHISEDKELTDIKKMASSFSTSYSQLHTIIKLAQPITTVDFNFIKPYNEVSYNLAHLRNLRAFDPNLLIFIKSIITSIDEILLHARLAIDSYDEPSRIQMMKIFSEVKQIMHRLIQSTRTVIGSNHNSSSDLLEMRQITSTLDSLLRELVFQIGPNTFNVSLIFKSKDLATELMITCHCLQESIESGQHHIQVMQQLHICTGLFEELLQILANTLSQLPNSSQSLDQSLSFQNIILFASQTAPVLKNIVSTFDDLTIKHQLSHSANTIGDLVSVIQSIISSANIQNTQFDIHELLEVVQSANTELDALLLSSQNTLCNISANSNMQQNTVQLFDELMIELQQLVSNMALESKSSFTPKLYEFIQELVQLNSQITSSIKMIFSVMNDKNRQVNLIQLAKCFNDNLANIMSTACTLSNQHKDKDLQASLEIAVETFNHSIDTLRGATRGIDNSRIIRLVQDSSFDCSQLDQVAVSSSPSSDFKDAHSALLDLARMLYSSIMETNSHMKAGPRVIESNVRFSITVVKQLLNAAAVVATKAPSKESGMMELDIARDLVTLAHKALTLIDLVTLDTDINNQDKLGHNVKIQHILEEYMQRLNSAQLDPSLHSFVNAANELDDLANKILDPSDRLQTNGIPLAQISIQELDQIFYNIAQYSSSVSTLAHSQLVTLQQDTVELVENIKPLVYWVVSLPIPYDYLGMISMLKLDLSTLSIDICLSIQDNDTLKKISTQYSSINSKLNLVCQTASNDSEILLLPKFSSIISLVKTSSSSIAIKMESGKLTNTELSNLIDQLVKCINLFESTIQQSPQYNTKDDADNLENANKNLSLTTCILIQALSKLVRSIISLSNDSENSANTFTLNKALESVSTQLAQLINCCNLLHEGRVECGSAIQCIKQTISNLDKIIMQRALGSHSTDVEKGTYAQSKDNLLLATTQLTQSISMMNSACQREPAYLKKVVKLVIEQVPIILSSSVSCASTTIDQALQENLLKFVRGLLDSCQHLMRAVRSARSFDQASLKAVADASKHASYAVVYLVTQLKANDVMHDELSQHLSTIESAAELVKKPLASTVSTKPYNQICQSIQGIIFDIVECANSIPSNTDFDLNRVIILSSELSTRATEIAPLVVAARIACQSEHSTELAQLAYTFLLSLYQVVKSSMELNPSVPDSEKRVFTELVQVQVESTNFLRALKHSTDHDKESTQSLAVLSDVINKLNRNMMIAQVGKLVSEKVPSGKLGLEVLIAEFSAIINILEYHIDQLVNSMRDSPSALYAWINQLAQKIQKFSTYTLDLVPLLPTCHHSIILSHCRSFTLGAQQLALAAIEINSTPNSSNMNWMSNSAKDIKTATNSLRQLIDKICLARDQYEDVFQQLRTRISRASQKVAVLLAETKYAEIPISVYEQLQGSIHHLIVSLTPPSPASNDSGEPSNESLKQAEQITSVAEKIISMLRSIASHLSSTQSSYPNVRPLLQVIDSSIPRIVTAITDLIQVYETQDVNISNLFMEKSMNITNIFHSLCQSIKDKMPTSGESTIPVQTINSIPMIVEKPINPIKIPSPSSLGTKTMKTSTIETPALSKPSRFDIPSPPDAVQPSPSINMTNTSNVTKSTSSQKLDYKKQDARFKRSNSVSSLSSLIDTPLETDPVSSTAGSLSENPTAVASISSNITVTPATSLSKSILIRRPAGSKSSVSLEAKDPILEFANQIDDQLIHLQEQTSSSVKSNSSDTISVSLLLKLVDGTRLMGQITSSLFKQVYALLQTKRKGTTKFSTMGSGNLLFLGISSVVQPFSEAVSSFINLLASIVLEKSSSQDNGVLMGMLHTIITTSGQFFNVYKMRVNTSDMESGNQGDVNDLYQQLTKLANELVQILRQWTDLISLEQSKTSSSSSDESNQHLPKTTANLPSEIVQQKGGDSIVANSSSTIKTNVNPSFINRPTKLQKVATNPNYNTWSISRNTNMSYLGSADKSNFAVSSNTKLSSGIMDRIKNLGANK